MNKLNWEKINIEQIERIKRKIEYLKLKSDSIYSIENLWKKIKKIKEINTLKKNIEHTIWNTLYNCCIVKNKDNNTLLINYGNCAYHSNRKVKSQYHLTKPFEGDIGLYSLLFSTENLSELIEKYQIIDII